MTNSSGGKLADKATQAKLLAHGLYKYASGGNALTLEEANEIMKEAASLLWLLADEVQFASG